MTTTQRIRIQEVLVHLGIEDDRLLRLLREEGLFEADEIDPREADEFRVAALMMEELGVNPAGVQVALHLRRRLIVLEARAAAMLTRLQEEGN
ncbi:MAG: hypothetical protein JRJ58_00010 [Deltaproteobacteria bacterium]|nr:hypothetical protein [Deltaproteobacteria bacterium]